MIALRFPAGRGSGAHFLRGAAGQAVPKDSACCAGKTKDFCAAATFLDVFRGKRYNNRDKFSARCGARPWIGRGGAVRRTGRAEQRRNGYENQRGDRRRGKLHAHAGGGVSKLMMTVGGEPVLRRTLRAFDAAACISEIVVVARESDFADVRQAAAGIGKPLRITTGGRDRQASVANGVSLCIEADFVAIHDGARPFVTRR